MIQNKNGLVPLKILRPDGKYCPGDVAGFRPEHAKRLCENGPAGQLPKARYLTQEEHDELTGKGPSEEPKVTREVTSKSRRVVKKEVE